MQRVYDRELQVAVAKRIRLHSSSEWNRFRNRWQAYNALYNVIERKSTERQQARQLISEFMQEEQALGVLRAVDNEVQQLCEIPPGDTRFDSTSSRFRRESTQDAAVVLNPKRSAVDRLSHLMGLVYQVRCSLIHGNKDPDVQRDHDLVGWSNTVLKELLPVIESALQTHGH